MWDALGLIVLFLSLLENVSATDDGNDSLEYFGYQGIGELKVIWPEIDDRIEAMEEEYHRHRRQILLETSKYRKDRKNPPGESTEGGTCPSRCTCQLPQEVHCTFKFFSEVPEDLPDQVEKLNLGFNKISDLPPRSLEKCSATLRYLFLHSNDIGSLGNGLFAKMNKIEVLRLSWNKITGIRKIALHGLHEVERLYLDNNRLTFIHPLAFRGLVNLKLLQLNGNRLSRLHQDLFVTLEFQKYFKYSSIHFLYLAKNNLIHLPRHLFDHMGRLKFVYLHGNPWDCSCEMKWMKKWIEEEKKYKCKRNSWRPSTPEECATCNLPPKFKNRRLNDVSSSNFSCEPPQFDDIQGVELVQSAHYDPVMLDFQNEVTLLRFGGFYSASMNIRLDSHKRSVLHAKCNLTRVPSVKVWEIFENSTRTPEMASNHTYAASFDGRLQCFVEYPENFKHLQKILDPYLDRELNLTQRKMKRANPGENQMVYSVSVKGLNKPPIHPLTGASISSAWEFMRSETSTILIENGRINPHTNSFHIVFGSTFTYKYDSRFVSYSKKPWALIRQPRRSPVDVTVALERKVAAFRCKAIGQPKPEITWILPTKEALRSGQKSGRFSVSRSGKLIVRRAAEEDSGFYHCVATIRKANSKKTEEFVASEVAELAVMKLQVFSRTKDNFNVYSQLQMQTVERGEVWTSDCNIKSLTNATIGWVTPGNQFLAGEGKVRYGRVSTNGNGRIAVAGFKKSDQGLYRCVAANIAGSTEHSIFVGMKSNDDQLIETIFQTESPEMISHLIDATEAQPRAKSVPYPDFDSYSDPQVTGVEEETANGSVPATEAGLESSPTLETTPVNISRLPTPGTTGAVVVNEDRKSQSKPGSGSQDITEPLLDVFSNQTSPGTPVTTLIQKRLPEASSPKYSNFLETPATFDRIPVVVMPRAREHRTKAFTLTPTTGATNTETPADTQTTGHVTERLVDKQSLAPLAIPITQLLQTVSVVPSNTPTDGHADKEEILTSNSEQSSTKMDNTISSTTNPQQISNKTTQRTDILKTNETRSKIKCFSVRRQRPKTRKSFRAAKPLQWYNFHIQNRNAPVFVNKTIVTAHITSSNDVTHRTSDIIVPAKSIHERKNPKQPRLTTSLRSNISSNAGRRTNTVYCQYGSHTVMSCLPPQERQIFFSRWTFMWTLPSGVVLKRPRGKIFSTWRKFIHMNGSLILRSLKSEDSGVYSCMAQQNTQRVEYKRQVRLLVRSDGPRIWNLLRQTVKVKTGKSITLPCSATGHPRPSMSWKVPWGSTISRGERRGRFEVFANDTLSVNNIRRQDIGTYTCTASSPVGTRTRAVTLEMMSYPPRFHGTRRRTQRAERGQTVRISCPATGTPEPSFYWLLPKGKKIQANHAVFKGSGRMPKFKVLRNGTLVLSRADRSDVGVYYCVATNNVGRTVLTTVLLMTGG